MMRSTILAFFIFLLLLALPARGQNDIDVIVFHGATNRVLNACGDTQAVFNVSATSTACGANVTVTCTPSSGSVFPINASTLVTCVATDCQNITATNTFYMTVIPPPPAFGVVNNITYVSCTNTLIEFGAPDATSPCCPNITVTCRPASGTFSLGPGMSTNVICDALDNCHAENGTVTNFLVSVVAATLQLTCSQDKTVPYDSNWSFDSPDVVPGCCTDPNPTPTVLATVTNLSGAFTVTRSWRVTNTCGESASCQQTVTLDFSGSFGGVASADSGDFTLDTTGTLPGTGGVAAADSDDFILDTTGTLPGIGGVAQADSPDFTLDTTGTLPGVGGVTLADSLDFKLDTTGASGAYADSLDFTLDTRGLLPFLLMTPMTLPGGAFQFSFTNTPGVGFSVYGVTDLTLPFSNWTYLGTATEIVPPGQYQFSDPQRSNYPQRFYRVISQ